MELTGWNVVVIARSFNPSILNQLWLVRNSIAQEPDFQPGSVFADVASQVNATTFSLIVIPDMLQFAPKVPAASSGPMVMEKVGGIVKALPHTPYIGVGLNFVWHETPKDETVNDMTRRLFAVPGNPLYSAFDAADAKFGSYLSKDFEGLRLKLDIKPIFIGPPVSQSRIQYAFNFHQELTLENPVQSIERVLALWDTAHKYSESLCAESKRELVR